MILKHIFHILAVGAVAIGLGFTSLTFAEEPRNSQPFYQFFQGHWSLNPAGQLQLWFDPLHNGHNEFEETYTVILNDRAPKMCGDPDGTGRHTWFFTDALLIEVVPVRSQTTPMYPQSFLQKETPQ